VSDDPAVIDKASLDLIDDVARHENDAVLGLSHSAIKLLVDDHWAVH
jgi:hypothetical protein